MVEQAPHTRKAGQGSSPPSATMVLWCNGSTTAFDAVSPGSNPGGTSLQITRAGGLLRYRTRQRTARPDGVSLLLWRTGLIQNLL